LNLIQYFTNNIISVTSYKDSEAVAVLYYVLITITKLHAKFAKYMLLLMGKIEKISLTWLHF